MSDSSQDESLAYDAKPPRMHPWALGACVFGILSITFAICVFPAGVFGVLAIVVGRAALQEMRENSQLEGRRIAVAGMIMGTISLLLLGGALLVLLFLRVIP